MTITLPDELREVLEARAKARGYATVDEYVQDRVECDEPELELTDAMRDRLIELAEEGLRSPPIEDPEGFMRELLRRSEAGEDIEDLRQ